MGPPVTRTAWAALLLGKLGYSASRATVTGLVAWMLAEGGWYANGATFNPLNTTEPAPGSTTINSVGVRAYVSLEQGLSATVATLRNGRYPGVLIVLANGGAPALLAQAVAASPWGTGAGVFRTIDQAAAEVAAELGGDVAAFSTDDDERRALIRLWWYTVHHGELSGAQQTWCTDRWAQTGSGDLVLAAIIDGTAPK